MGALQEFQNELKRKGFGVFYSTVFLPSGTTLSNKEANFFTYGVGVGTIPGAAAAFSPTLRETNLRGQGGQASAQFSFMVHGMALFIANSTTDGSTASHAPVSSKDLHNLSDNGSLLQWILTDGTPIEIAPLRMIPGSGVGGAGVAGTAGAAPSELLMGDGVYRLGHKFPIYPQATFKIALTFPQSAAAPDVTLSLQLVLIGEYGTLIPEG